MPKPTSTPVKSKPQPAAKKPKTKAFLPDREKISATKNKGPLIVKVTGGAKTAVTNGGKVQTVPRTIKDLRGASYNPRYISESQLAKLKRSMESFGDLSGVVFNASSGVVISGHQRLKTMAGKKTQLVRKACKDGRGTIAEGYIQVMEADGSTARVPYREVNWSDRQTEIAANIAANAHGGDFDDLKLGTLLHKLHSGKFDIELVGVSELDFRRTVLLANREKGDSSGQGIVEIDPDDDTGTTKTKTAGSCKCPRCGFKFDPK